MTSEQPRPGSLTDDGAARYLLSVRMRASRQGKHLGGAERLVPPDCWLSAIISLQNRALGYGQADQVHIGSEFVPGAKISRVPALPVQTSACADVESARQDALRALEEAGVAAVVARDALRAIDSGPGPGNTVMRGAMLIDAATGQRLEPDAGRGIRVSRVDYTPRCRELIRSALQSAGLSSHRTLEAIAVATKVIWSGIACELCWSDDPNYVAGYIASAASGYRRFRQIKRPGQVTGGRAFFFHNAAEVPSIIRRLEQDALLIDSFGAIEGRSYP